MATLSLLCIAMRWGRGGWVSDMAMGEEVDEKKRGALSPATGHGPAPAAQRAQDQASV
jgi:hypothetical protein